MTQHNTAENQYTCCACHTSVSVIVVVAQKPNIMPAGVKGLKHVILPHIPLQVWLTVETKHESAN